MPRNLSQNSELLELELDCLDLLDAEEELEELDSILFLFRFTSDSLISARFDPHLGIID